METSRIAGGCLCGAIRYRAHGPARHATLCHCRTCRRAAGAPVVAWITVPADGLAFVSGTPVEFRSSPKVTRTFCGACGTPLTYVHADYPAGVDVTTCSLEEPEHFEPADQTWVSHRLPWLRVNEHLRAYPKTRED